MEFGKHLGKPISQLPAEYLEWLVRSKAGGEEFQKQLRQFIKSGGLI